MIKTNKILIGLILISSLFLAIGYAAIENITLDINGTVTAIPTTRILVTGQNFNTMLKEENSSVSTSDTTITRIVFDYWENGYLDNGTQVYSNEDWEAGTPIDVDGLGGIRLFKSSDGTVAYILSEVQIYGNANCTYMFERMEAAEEFVFNNFDTSKVQRMTNMFRRCSKLNELDLGTFKTSNVQRMDYMFNWCTNLTKLNLSGMDTSNVQNMSSMFAACLALKEINVQNFNTSRVTSMDRMFNSCVMPVIDLSSFDTSNVTNMKKMFTDNTNLTTIYVSDKWTTAKVDHSSITAEEEPFLGCTKLVGGAGTTYNSSNVDITYARVDGGPNSLYPGYLTLKTTPKTLVAGENFNKMLKGSTSTSTSDTTITKIVFDYWRYGYLEGGTYVYEDSDWAKGTAIDAEGAGAIRLFKSSDGTKAYILSEAPIYANVDCTDMFYHMEGVNELCFNNFDTIKVENMYRFFRRCDAIQTLDISGFNTENVTNMYDMFGSCVKLSNIKGLNTLKTSKVTDMARMFWQCKSLTTLDVTTFDTSNVTDMTQMLGACDKLTEIKFGSGFDTSKVKNMNSMFYCDFKLTEIDVSLFDTSNVTSMAYMFGSCTELTKIKFGKGFNTSKVTSMDSMFIGENKLTEIDLTHFDTSNVKNMTKMFSNNTKLKTIYVSNIWSTAKVTESTNMFSNCNSLVGGAGTTFNSSYIDKTYARVDGGTNSQIPGYFTLKSST